MNFNKNTIASWAKWSIISQTKFKYLNKFIYCVGNDVFIPDFDSIFLNTIFLNIKKS